MYTIPDRPKNVPATATFNKNEQRWQLFYYNTNHVIIGQALEWYPDGVLAEAAIHTGDEGDTLTYKAYSQNGELWQEGAFAEGQRISKINYRCKGYEFIFNESYQVPKQAVRIEDIRFAPYNGTLAYIAYDKDNNIVDQYNNTEITYTDFEWTFCGVREAVVRGNFAVAQKRYEALTVPKDNKQVYDVFGVIIAYLMKQQPISQEIYDNCMKIADFEVYQAVTIKPIYDYFKSLLDSEAYNQLIDFLQDIIEKDWFGTEIDNPFWEFGVAALIRSGMKTVSDDDAYLLRQLMRIEQAGKRTEITDFLMESPEVIAYSRFLENVPEYSQYDSGQLIFDGDVIWDNDYYVEDINLYYPELSGKNVYDIIIHGDFIVKGKISSKTAFNCGSGIASFVVSGNMEADSMYLLEGITVGGNLKATHYIYYWDRSQHEFVYKLKVGKTIAAPLFYDYSDKLKHTGGFSENCLYIAANSASGKYVKVHLPENIREDIYVPVEWYHRMDFDKLVTTFEAGENIFQPGYDPNQDAGEAWEKLETAEQWLAVSQPEQALDILNTVTEKSYFGENLAAFVRDYDKIQALTMLDAEANANKIMRLYQSMAKSYKSGSLSGQPQWDMLQTMTEYLVAHAIENGNDKKVLELINKVNRGDAAHYLQKAELLWRLGKEKEAYFPAYIALKHYRVNGLEMIAADTGFIDYCKQCESEIFILPMGYKNKYDRAIDKTPFAEYIDKDEYEKRVVIYKGDVFWNGDLFAVEAIAQMPPKVFCNNFIVLGDLYITGDAFFHQINLYVTGNIFVNNYIQGDTTLICSGNIFSQKDFQLCKDIGGSNAIIYGNLSAKIIAAYPDEFIVCGNIAPETICIGLGNYAFEDFDLDRQIYTEADLQTDLDEIVSTDIVLSDRLENGTLFK